VVIIGGGRVRCETAEFLAEKGKKVTILEMLDQIGTDMGQMSKVDLLLRLGEKGVRMEIKTKAEKIISSGVLASTAGKEARFDADSVVLAVGSSLDNALAKELKGKITELYVIGDCVEPRRIQDAIHEGFRVGLHL